MAHEHTVNARFHFASDNTSGVCPEAWDALRCANDGYAPSYGDDGCTSDAADAFREWFECDCDVYFVFNGTAANSLALASLCQSYHSVIAHEFAHIATDECGAPEFFSNGTKLLLATGEGGKIRPEMVETLISQRSDIHYPKPRVLSLSQPTELGAIYTRAELQTLSALAHLRGLKVHLDGARFMNAVAALDVKPREASWESGVDVLCFGGTKAGIGFSDAVVFFDRALAEDFAYRCKQAGQLASKMRFLAAPWAPILRQGTWLRYARHANSCARALGDGLDKLPGVRLLRRPEANAVFAEIPPVVVERLRYLGWRFYTFIGGGARFMCSWKTTAEDVNALVNDVTHAVALN